MKPDLKIHSYDKKDADDSGTVSELTQWLTSAATLQVSELEGKVRQFHHIECSDHQRLELLDWIRPLVTNTAEAVREAIAEGQLPLPVHVLNHVDGLARIYAVMADLYKSVVLNLAFQVLQNSDESHENRKEIHEDLILACYGAINFLAEQLRATYEGYRPAPETVWHEIHHIYNYSRFIIDASLNSEVNDEKMRDEFFLIEHIYKRSLLLGLCNPYHFPVDAFGELNRSLNKWAHLCSLDHDAHLAEQTCMFSVDAESDYPAAPVLSHSGKLATTEQYSVLNTKKLVNKLNTDINLMAKEAFDYPDKNSSGKFLQRIEMYRRLIMNWGRHPVRQDVRQEKQGSCESVSGYNEIMKSMGGMLVNALKKTPLDKQRCCAITDASEMGYQVEMTSSTSTRFRIGEMIAIRDEKKLDQWSLAVVRWARYTRSNGIRVGMFIMGHQAERYKLQVELASDQTINVMSVSGTSNFPSDKKILLMPTGIYRPGKVMQLTGSEDHRVCAGNILMSGADFDVIDYKVIG
jgi:hypothetical protein